MFFFAFFYFVVRSFALKFHLVLKAFLYVRFDCFSASLLPRLGRLLRVFSFARLTLTSFLVVIAHTSLSAAQCLLFRRRRRYKIRSSVFGGLPTTTSQNGVASLSAIYLALLSRTHAHTLTYRFLQTQRTAKVDFALDTLAETA